MKEADAARLTFTGKMVGKLGLDFDRIKFVSIVGEPGKYTEVILKFRK